MKKHYIVEDKYGFRVPEWLFDEKVLKIAYKLKLLKKILKPFSRNKEK